MVEIEPVKVNPERLDGRFVLYAHPITIGSSGGSQMKGPKSQVYKCFCGGNKWKMTSEIYSRIPRAREAIEDMTTHQSILYLLMSMNTTLDVINDLPGDKFRLKGEMPEADNDGSINNEILKFIGDYTLDYICQTKEKFYSEMKIQELDLLTPASPTSEEEIIRFMQSRDGKALSLMAILGNFCPDEENTPQVYETIRTLLDMGELMRDKRRFRLGRFVQ